MLRLLIIIACLLPAGCGAPPREQPPSLCTVLAFTAPWCAPCRQDKPKLAEIARRVVVKTIDADSNQALLDRYGVSELPTYIVLRGNREVLRTHKISAVQTFIGQ